jgi:hypothetical protein
MSNQHLVEDYFKLMILVETTPGIWGMGDN